MVASTIERSALPLAEQITEERPKLKVLYMTGYTDNIIAHHGIMDQQQGVFSLFGRHRGRGPLDSKSF
jgi:hypothetical protein